MKVRNKEKVSQAMAYTWEGIHNIHAQDGESTEEIHVVTHIWYILHVDVFPAKLWGSIKHNIK